MQQGISAPSLPPLAAIESAESDPDLLVPLLLLTGVWVLVVLDTFPKGSIEQASIVFNQDRPCRLGESASAGKRALLCFEVVSSKVVGGIPWLHPGILKLIHQLAEPGAEVASS